MRDLSAVGEGKEAQDASRNSTHPIDDEQLAAHVRARLAREEDDGPGEVGGLAPPPRGDALADLAQARRVREELLVPTFSQLAPPTAKRNLSTYISVLTYPGTTAFTLTPCALHSFASALTSWPTPPFAAAYAGTVSPPWKVRSDAKWMMEPRRRGSMCAPAACERRNAALRFVERTWGRVSAGYGGIRRASAAGGRCARARWKLRAPGPLRGCA